MALTAEAASPGAIDIFAGSIGSISHITDPTVPNDYGPLGIQNLNGKIYVTFAEQDPNSPHDDLKGAGHGFVDVLDPSTNTLTRLISGGHGAVGNFSSSFNSDLFLFDAENGGIFGDPGQPSP